MAAYIFIERDAWNDLKFLQPNCHVYCTLHDGWSLKEMKILAIKCSFKKRQWWVPGLMGDVMVQLVGSLFKALCWVPIHSLLCRTGGVLAFSYFNPYCLFNHLCSVVMKVTTFLNLGRLLSMEEQGWFAKETQYHIAFLILVTGFLWVLQNLAAESFCFLRLWKGLVFMDLSLKQVYFPLANSLSIVKAHFVF